MPEAAFEVDGDIKMLGAPAKGRQHAATQARGALSRASAISAARASRLRPSVSLIRLLFYYAAGVRELWPRRRLRSAIALLPCICVSFSALDGLHPLPPPCTRLQGAPLLHGYRVHVRAPIDKLEMSEFCGLLEAAGATLVNDALARTDSGAFTLVSAARLSPTAAAQISAAYASTVLDQSWLLDSISSHAVQPAQEYGVAVVRGRLA